MDVIGFTATYYNTKLWFSILGSITKDVYHKNHQDMIQRQYDINRELERRKPALYLEDAV